MSVLGGSGARIQVFEHQADATLSQANPVSGTKYTVLDTTKNVRVVTAFVSVTWTVQPTPLQIHVTIDGNSLTHQVTNPVSATNYELALNNQGETAQPLSVEGTRLNWGFCYEGRSIKIEVETTGGTVSNLSATVKYAKVP